MSKLKSMLQYLREDIINHVLDCPSFVGLHAQEDHLSLQIIVRCICGRKWIIDAFRYRENTDPQTKVFFNMLQADNFSIDNRLFKEYIDVARANRAIEIEKKRAIETEECRAREAIRLQIICFRRTTFQ